MTAVLSMFLSSCNDYDGDYATMQGFVTLHSLNADGTDYYFETDTGTKLFPTDKSRFQGFKAIEGKRALIYFNILDGKEPGYDYSIALYSVMPIYTDTATVISSQEELDKIKPAQVKVLRGWLSKRYLTLAIAAPINTASEHKFRLFINDVEGEQQPNAEQYLKLELRHDAGKDEGGYENGFYVSFDLSNVIFRFSECKGILLNFYNGMENVSRTIDFLPEADKETMSRK